MDKGNKAVECWINSLPLMADKYHLHLHIYDSTHTIPYDFWDGAIIPNLHFQVLPNKMNIILGEYSGICNFPVRWVIK